MTYQVDYHTHTLLCKHATGTVQDYVRHAHAIGLNEIGFSDHTPFPIHFDEESRMSPDDFPLYMHWVQSAQTLGDELGIKVRCALEMDFVKDRMSEIEQFMKKTDFDYLICSCHYVQNFAFDHPKYISLWDTTGMPNKVWKSYAESLLEMVEIGGFEIIGHFDLPKKFGYRPNEIVQKEVDCIFQKVFQVAAKNEIALEINTSAIRKGCADFYPSEKYIKMAYENGCDITFGSDAHRPEEVGFMLNEAMDLAYCIGFRQLATFEKRCKILRPLRGKA